MVNYRIIILISSLLFCSFSFSATELLPLQPLIDKLSKGDTLIIPPGNYMGPIVVEKAVTLDGQHKVTIDAGGKGSVIYLDTDGATIKNLHLTNSGEFHNDLDSGVQVRGNFNVIKDNVIDNCLFGIDLQQSENNIVRRNKISSKPFDLGLRGDAIRLWYSFNNTISDNEINNTRDMVVWYSKDNIIKNNKSSNGRYGLHFMYSQFNKVIGNEYHHNSVGIFLMYSDGVVIKNNTITHATGASGVGIGFKETSDIKVINNKILFSSAALSIDVSPYQPDTINYFEDNLIAFNSIGIRFLADWKGNVFKNNQFKSNISQIIVSGGRTANRNAWEGNYWDDYEGFDVNKDGEGDTPYELYAYADRIWKDVPNAQFFKGSPILEMIDFLERLAPFSPPSLVVRDKKPVIDPLINLKRNSAVDKSTNRYFK
jgi:nitrous oxidase accessory protein